MIRRYGVVNFIHHTQARLVAAALGIAYNTEATLSRKVEQHSDWEVLVPLPETVTPAEFETFVVRASRCAHELFGTFHPIISTRTE